MVDFANEVDLCGNQSYYGRMGVGECWGEGTGMGWASTSKYIWQRL